MRSAKFLHAADLHIGSPLNSLGNALGETEANRIRDLAKGALDRLVQTAIDEEVDFVVLAGDIYDNAEGDNGSRRRLLLALRRLTEIGIRVFMAHGNHDPLTKDMKNGLLPEGVVVFPPAILGIETVTMRNGAEVLVAGVSYSKKHEEQNFVPLFAGLRSRTVVGVLHTNVGDNSEHGNYAPCLVSDLEKSPVNYWALGHIHIRRVEPTLQGWWAYPGNLQGRSTKAAECGPKGVLIVEVDEIGSLSEPRFVECSTFRYQRVLVPIDHVTEVEGVNDAVTEVLQKLVDDANGIPLLVKLELTGQTDLSELLEEGKWEKDETIQEANVVLNRGAVVRFEISCLPRVDLDEHRNRKTLLGAALIELDNEILPPDLREAAASLLVKFLGVPQ